MVAGRVKVLFLTVALLFLAGCKDQSNSDILTELMNQQEQNELLLLSQKAEIANLKKEIEEGDKRNEALNADLIEIRNQLTTDERNLNMLRKIAGSLTQPTEKMAFVQTSVVDGERLKLNLEYVEWFSGDKAAEAAIMDDKLDEAALENGYYIRNTHDKLGTVYIDNETLIYMLNGSIPELAYLQRFYDDPESLVGRLIHIYTLNEQVIAIEEQYRP